MSYRKRIAGWTGAYLDVCQKCGFKYYSNMLRVQYNGLRVCTICFDPKPPKSYGHGGNTVDAVVIDND